MVGWNHIQNFRKSHGQRRKSYYVKIMTQKRLGLSQSLLVHVPVFWLGDTCETMYESGRAESPSFLLHQWTLATLSEHSKRHTHTHVIMLNDHHIGTKPASTAIINVLAPTLLPPRLPYVLYIGVPLWHLCNLHREEVRPWYL